MGATGEEDGGKGGVKGNDEVGGGTDVDIVVVTSHLVNAVSPADNLEFG